MEKRTWYKLKSRQCPTIGVKTTLVDENNVLRCPKCGGEWILHCFAPMDITWLEIKKPKEIK